MRNWIAKNATTIFFFLFVLNTLAQQKPNILCLVCEDISPYLACYGDSTARTPQIDQLALEGVRYANFFTTMGVCAPSRAALITGMYPSAIGANQMRNTGNAKAMPNGIEPYDVVLPEGVKCFTEFLRQAGYYCTNNAKNDCQFTPPLTAWDENGKNAEWKNTPKGKPFFSIYNFEVTHESQLWQRANEKLNISPEKINIPPYFPDDPVVRNDMARMYDNIELMDQQIQSKIEELQEAGILENTIIIFYSDNGGPLPRQKRSVYNSGLQVPLIIRYPHRKFAGQTENRLCSFVDLPATILSLAGIKPPDYMHGKAFAGSYMSEERDFIFGAKDRCDEKIDKIGTVRDLRYQYIRNYMPEIAGYTDVNYRKSLPMMRDMLEKRDAGMLNVVQMSWFKAPRPVEEFYDLANDPHEINNLIHSNELKSEIERLRHAYNEWVKKYNKQWFLPETEMVKLMLPNGSPEVVNTPVLNLLGDSITMLCPTKGASIAYRLNGKGTNLNNWFLYSGPVKSRPGDLFEVTASRAGFIQSAIVSYFIGVSEENKQIIISTDVKSQVPVK